MLLSASMVFYAYAGWKSMIYLLCLTVITYIGAIGEAKLQSKAIGLGEEGNEANAKRIKRIKWQKILLLATVLLLCFGAMILLKIYNAYATSVSTYFADIKSQTTIKDLAIFIPLGLSYFTFQSAGYVIDIYWNKYKPEKNPLKYLLFVSFFPQMTQGPISTWPQLSSQLLRPSGFQPETFIAGGQLLLWGYFKKLVIADRLAPIISSILSQTDAQYGWIFIFGAAAFAIRLYADFSGGMDIVRGVAIILGVDLVENFKRPFFSKTISEYWRRWHISLGTWFRTYVYYPLTFSRMSTKIGVWGQKLFGKKTGYALPSAFATVIIFLGIGIWHTAYINAVFYGLYFGIILGSAVLLEPIFSIIRKKLRFSGKTLIWNAFRYVRTWILIVIAQYFALAANPKQTLELLKISISNLSITSFINSCKQLWEIQEPLEWAILGAAILLLLIVDLVKERGYQLNDNIARAPIYVRWPLVIALILIILIFGCYGEGFDSATFLYTQF